MFTAVTSSQIPLHGFTAGDVVGVYFDFKGNQYDGTYIPIVCVDVVIERSLVQLSIATSTTSPPLSPPVSPPLSPPISPPVGTVPMVAPVSPPINPPVGTVPMTAPVQPVAAPVATPTADPPINPPTTTMPPVSQAPTVINTPFAPITWTPVDKIPVALVPSAENSTEEATSGANRSIVSFLWMATIAFGVLN